MAYLRGKYYLWSDSEGIHLWAHDGYDQWDMAGWAVDDDDKPKTGYEKASGVSIHQHIMDEYVVMRMAQMLYEGIAEETIDRTIAGGVNVGGMMLKKNAETLKAAFRQITMDDAEPYVWKRNADNQVIIDK